MLKELKFVMGAVSKKDLVPSMTHFVIEGGHVRAYNGMVALSSPIPFSIDCKPKGSLLYQAIDNCEDEINLYMTPGGKLGVKSGSFRTLIPCIEETSNHPTPEGDHVEFDGEALLKAFRVLEPLIGDDASRPWQAGILLRGQSAFATCNVVLAEYWLGVNFPHVVNIPGMAVREILRINEPPVDAQCTDTSFTFHFSDGRWVRTQMLPTDWPDLARIFDKPCNPTPVDPRIFTAVDKLRKFTDKAGRIYFEPGIAHTELDPEAGSHFEMPGSEFTGIYNWEMLKLLDGVATSADFSTPGKPCQFYGDVIRGAIIGLAR